MGAVTITAFAGFLVGFLALRLKGHYLAMATLGFQIIISVVMLELYFFTGGSGGYQVSSVISIGSFQFNNDTRFFYLTWSFLAVAFWGTSKLVSSRIGRGLYAIKEYELLAEVCGVPPGKFKLKVFTYAAGLAGLAGSLYVYHVLSIDPASFSIHISLILLIMVVVGGLGNVWGTFLGTATLYLLPEIIRKMAEIKSLSPTLRQALSDNNFHLLIFGIILAIFVIFLPKGISGIFSRQN